MRQRFWPDGKRIHVFVLRDNHELHRQFTKTKLNMFAHQFRRIWDRLIFSGTGQAPTTVNSITEMIDNISSTPGAIGYIENQPVEKDIRIFIYE